MSLTRIFDSITSNDFERNVSRAEHDADTSNITPITTSNITIRNLTSSVRYRINNVSINTDTNDQDEVDNVMGADNQHTVINYYSLSNSSSGDSTESVHDFDDQIINYDEEQIQKNQPIRNNSIELKSRKKSRNDQFRSEEQEVQFIDEH